MCRQTVLLPACCKSRRGRPRTRKTPVRIHVTAAKLGDVHSPASEAPFAARCFIDLGFPIYDIDNDNVNPLANAGTQTIPNDPHEESSLVQAN